MPKKATDKDEKQKNAKHKDEKQKRAKGINKSAPPRRTKKALFSEYFRRAVKYTIKKKKAAAPRTKSGKKRRF